MAVERCLDGNFHLLFMVFVGLVKICFARHGTLRIMCNHSFIKTFSERPTIIGFLLFRGPRNVGIAGIFTDLRSWGAPALIWFHCPLSFWLETRCNLDASRMYSERVGPMPHSAC